MSEVYFYAKIPGLQKSNGKPSFQTFIFRQVKDKVELVVVSEGMATSEGFVDNKKIQALLDKGISMEDIIVSFGANYVTEFAVLPDVNQSQKVSEFRFEGMRLELEIKDSQVLGPYHLNTVKSLITEGLLRRENSVVIPQDIMTVTVFEEEKQSLNDLVPEIKNMK